MNNKVIELILARLVAYVEDHPELVDKLIDALIGALLKLGEHKA